MISRYFFGLGSSQEADSVQVLCPSGRLDVLKKIAGGRYVILKEGQEVLPFEEFSARPKL